MQWFVIQMAHQMASAEASVCIPQAQRALTFKDSKVLKGVSVNGVSKTGTNFKFEVQLVTFFLSHLQSKEVQSQPTNGSSPLDPSYFQIDISIKINLKLYGV